VVEKQNSPEGFIFWGVYAFIFLRFVEGVRLERLPLLSFGVNVETDGSNGGNKLRYTRLIADS
jgi:hypothetical protein